MSTALSRQIDQILVSAHADPAVSIILPFDPKMSAKQDISRRIQRVVDKVESSLRHSSNQPFARLVNRKLRNIIDNLNYSTFRKALAIYVSPVFEKVLYLDIDVEEKVVVDDSFDIRDIVHAKKENHSFLLLFIGERRNTVWFFNGIAPAMIRSVPVLDDSKAEEADSALRHLLDYYPFPLLVAGTGEKLKRFKACTTHSKRIAAYFSIECGEPVSEQVGKITTTITNWADIHERDIRNRILLAASNGRLAMGIEECWTKAVQNSRQLLVVERNYLVPATFGADHLSEDHYDHFSCVKDPVDDIIEKVLDAGGDVEFTDDGALSAYGHVVLLGCS